MASVANNRLGRDFFNRPCPEVARDLLGQILVFKDFTGIITETESYRGTDDPASHAFKGPTPRAGIMFGKPGISYVYLIYGMYHCLNIVTEDEGSASAVLIRGLKLISPMQKLFNGPGKLCRELGINKTHNNVDLITCDDFFVAKGDHVSEFDITQRIGIKTGLDKLWRFVAKV